MVFGFGGAVYYCDVSGTLLVPNLVHPSDVETRVISQG